jgi:vacuolar iron transporter family protein
MVMTSLSRREISSPNRERWSSPSVEHYASERLQEQQEIKEKPEAEQAEVRDVFTAYGLSVEESAPIVEALSLRPQAWTDFMMRFELGLEEPDPKWALTSALTIAASYVVGGLIPLSPYFFLSPATKSLVVSVVVTLLALLIFGYVKGRFTGAHPLRSALQTALIGGLAATSAFLIARFISR